MHTRLAPIAVLIYCLLPARAPADLEATVTISTGKPVNTFRPDRALGAGVDGHEKGDIARMYQPANLRAMRSAGLKPLTYRLRTELGIEAWHWNPRGRWSDPAHRQGYWTSSDRSNRPITVCNGYFLPRRGSTIDQAGNYGYSRIDDGDERTFWKSNPYLDRHFTGEANALHPQWVVIDLEKSLPVSAVRISWGVPYATEYAVEYWEGPDAIYVNENPDGQWKPFPGGTVTGGRGGRALLALAPKPISVRFIRIVMTESSHKAPAGSRDVRDRLGYAIRELYLGTLDRSGRVQDILRHGRSNRTQTVLYASSTDPWHRAIDRDPNVEQPGFDRVMHSGLTNGLPMLTPVPVLYDTPENAAAEIRFLRSRGYPVREIEMGEEPDGQYVTPEDYAALYVRWARALHAIDPTLKLGGPCFQTTVTDVRAWPDRPGNRSWMNRFLRYVEAKGRPGDYAFFSFEWYPFDDTLAPTAPQLQEAPDILAGVLRRLQADGLSSKISWMITEYGYSAFSGRPEVDIEGALLNADIVGQFLALGGDVAYLYGYEPNSLIQETPGAWGNNMILQADDEGIARYRIATYWGARLLSQVWAQPGGGLHRLYAADCDLRNAKGQALVTAYAVRRPDGRWAVMLINKDPRRAVTVRLCFRDPATGAVTAFPASADLYRYSRAQYLWKADGERGHPLRSLPPEHLLIHSSMLRIPTYSLSVVIGSS